LTKAQERRAKPFVIPLPATAVALFKELREVTKAFQASREDLEQEIPRVMTSPGSADGHYTDKSLAEAMSRLFGPPISLELPGGEATPHDLRRTMRTHLGDTLSVAPHIAERCLNHSLGKIVRTYDRGDYLADRRAALEKWDAYVLRLLDATSTNVVPLASGNR
jgi:integrase